MIKILICFAVLVHVCLAATTATTSAEKNLVRHGIVHVIRFVLTTLLTFPLAEKACVFVHPDFDLWVNCYYSSYRRAILSGKHHYYCSKHRTYYQPAIKCFLILDYTASAVGLGSICRFQFTRYCSDYFARDVVILSARLFWFVVDFI